MEGGGAQRRTLGFPSRGRSPAFPHPLPKALKASIQQQFRGVGHGVHSPRIPGVHHLVARQTWKEASTVQCADGDKGDGCLHGGQCPV